MKPDSKTLTEQSAKDVTELSTDFIGAERNLELIGFFSPSYNDRRKIPKKTISGTVTNKDGQKIKVQLSILPSAEYGLPITTDLDIYRAFQKILKDIYLEQGEITNPVTFRDEQIIKAMGKKRQGTYNKQIRTWLHRMKFTGILSEGLIYDKGKKQYIEDSVNVFDRTIAFGKELEAGKMAVKNYVWLSDWYLNNINSRYSFLIDNETHKRLKTAIAKSLYPILWFRFYGMRKQNGQYYRKRYASKNGRAGDKDSLCDILGIENRKRLSWIKRQLDGAHKELQKQGVISTWGYEKTADGQSYNIKWWAGPAFEQYYTGLKTYNKELASQKASLPASQEVDSVQQTLNLVLYFQKKKNDLDLYSPKSRELEQAAALIARRGDELTRRIVGFALDEMDNTHFDAKYFGAVMSYETQALEHFALIEKREKEAQEKEQVERQKNIEIYQWWRQATPQERVKSRLDFRITAFAMKHDRQPTAQDIEQMQRELIDSEPSPEQKQNQLFNRILFPEDHSTAMLK